jgi:hypothetical protein
MQDGRRRRRAVALGAALLVGIATPAAVTLLTSATARAAEAVTPTCTMTMVNDPLGPYQYPTQLSVEADAPALVQPQSEFTVTLPAEPRVLGTTNPFPEFLLGYNNVAIEYDVTGGTIADGSAAIVANGTESGLNVTATVVTTAHSIVVTTPGPLPPGTMISPVVTFAIQAADVGSTIDIQAAQATEMVDFEGGFGPVQGNSVCPLGTDVGSVAVSTDAPTTVATTTTTTSTTTTTTGSTTTTTDPSTTTTTTDPSGASTTTTTTSDPATTTTTTTTTGPPGFAVVSIGNAIVQEPASHSVAMYFTVTISPPDGNASVHFTTIDGTAAAPGDYKAKNGTLKFGRNQTSARIKVSVKADTLVEPNETMYVILSLPKNAVIGNALGMGTILDRPPVA